MKRIDFRSFVFSGVVVGFSICEFWRGEWVIVHV